MLLKYWQKKLEAGFSTLWLLKYWRKKLEAGFSTLWLTLIADSEVQKATFGV